MVGECKERLDDGEEDKGLVDGFFFPEIALRSQMVQRLVLRPPDEEDSGCSISASSADSEGISSAEGVVRELVELSDLMRDFLEDEEGLP